MSEKLNSWSWGNKHISLEGTTVLLNSVLNSIPIFHLSVFKMPVTVLKIKEAKISDLSRTHIKTKLIANIITCGERL